jgi:sugar phosphate isomerase/epimerase
MHNRRSFLKNSGAFALGSLFIPGMAEAAFLNKRASHAVGLQLFTLFGSIDKDVPGTLKQIAEIGYKEIESAFSMKGGFYGLKPKEFAALAKDSGLNWISHHVSGAPFKMPPGGIRMPGADTTKRVTMPNMGHMNNLKEDHQAIIDQAAEGGIEYLVCATIPLGTADEIKQAVPILSTAGEAAKKSGITLCYHNHIHEFANVDGMVPYDVLLSQISPDILKFELDLGWATVAGADPVALFNKNPGRFPLWHVKDISPDTKQPVEVGKGMVDFKRIFAAASASGMKHFFVEQDGAPQPMENIKASYIDITEKILV